VDFTKGETYEQGTYIGERSVERTQRLTSTQARATYDTLIAQGRDLGDEDNAVNQLADRALVHVFVDEDGNETEVPFEDV
jgi:hypothetical protein